MSNIQEISAQETYLVRNPVLRKGKPIESCHFDGDDLPTTHHFGLFDDKNLVGIISLFQKSNITFAENFQSQIRGMAVLDDFRKKGFGEALVNYCEKYCISNNCKLIWFNARTEAVGFYEKMGYQKTGAIFEIKDVGKHLLMFKKL
ncbi:GNAT family N-acetyltransferase [Flavobacterium hydatis]|uniref:Acetyltransferase n=1 Tax=Flavobacterium hydatis TaxID=991 RepID=A0A086ATB8_FLAHY|nr:GNAT family N-acetyltransferase [Flavobacterium hydatis]KFF19932.1 acetyltransferase [Flavobacterium hydatis]OXA91503.1 N-acetyltransferase [Flavobacterium hydatis]